MVARVCLRVARLLIVEPGTEGPSSPRIGRKSTVNIDENGLAHLVQNQSIATAQYHLLVLRPLLNAEADLQTSRQLYDSHTRRTPSSCFPRSFVVFHHHLPTSSMPLVPGASYATPALALHARYASMHARETCGGRAVTWMRVHRVDLYRHTFGRAHTRSNTAELQLAPLCRLGAASTLRSIPRAGMGGT
ncbi:hypothetical protein B0H12DRAFT_167540 [Mycena haematopus]|nr:hypothetical protein B0H12DRAFT_167540 [Mycena haematopus]